MFRNNGYNAPRTQRGTVEHHIAMLKRLRDWLALNPKGTQLVQDEHDAVVYALEQLGATE